MELKFSTERGWSKKGPGVLEKTAFVQKPMIIAGALTTEGVDDLFDAL